MSVKTEAKKDASEYARAQMFYGEGAGVRRKLISASVEHKMLNVQGYEEAFNKAYDDQDMSKHAEKASRERFQKDTAKKIERNVKGLASGNHQNLTGGVALLAAVGYVMHQTGADVIVKDKCVKQYRKSKAWAEMKYKMHKAKSRKH